MSFLVVTIPVTLLLATGLLALVVRAVRNGDFDDLEGPAQRMVCDDDATPELDAPSRPARRDAGSDRTRSPRPAS
jgi:cbb3-type cytochrome oxidase maturation protein